MFATAILQSLPVELLFTVALRHGAVRCYILLLQCLMGGVRVGREIIFFLKECCRRETFQKSYKTSLLELPCITRAALLLIRKRNDLSSIHTWCFSGFWYCCTSWAEMTPSHTPFTQQGRERQNTRISVLHYGPPWATKLPVNSYYKSNK